MNFLSISGVSPLEEITFKRARDSQKEKRENLKGNPSPILLRSTARLKRN